MTFFLICMLMMNVFLGVVIYLVMKKKCKLYSDRYGMTMAMVSSAIISFQIAMMLQFISNDSTLITTILTILLSGLIGILIGSMVKFQSLLSGFFHGIMGGITGNMIGMVILNPTLCSLPAAFSNTIDQHVMIFSLFGTGLVVLTLSLLFYSLRV